MYLVYVSSQSAGYLATLIVHLTSRRPPVNLALVHLRVVVEGVDTQQVLVAQPNLNYTFSWNRLNAYQQTVYGLTTAISTLYYTANQKKQDTKLLSMPHVNRFSKFLH